MSLFTTRNETFEKRVNVIQMIMRNRLWRHSSSRLSKFNLQKHHPVT